MYRGNSLKGVIAKILDEKSGSSNQSFWRVQELIIKYDQKYPKYACISFGSEKIDLLQDFRVGDSVQVNFRIESKQGKRSWHTNLKAIGIKMNYID